MKIYHCYSTIEYKSKNLNKIIKIKNTQYVGTNLKDALLSSKNSYKSCIIDTIHNKEIIKSLLVMNGYIVKEINKNVDI